MQLVLSLAASEKHCKFEHRDLHWGNVLVSTPISLTYSFNKNLKAIIQSCGVRVTIIDFTLSRLEQSGDINFVSLNDENLYEGKGDYQFDIYRKMREVVKDDWQGFYPYTNVLVNY